MQSERTNWGRVSRVSIPIDTGVIAIHGINSESRGYAGIVASAAGPVIVTDESWKCSNTLETGWNEKCFDDDHWSPAVILGSIGDRPWRRGGTLRDISSAAKWIWTMPVPGPEDKEIYCRKRLQPGANFHKKL